MPNKSEYLQQNNDRNIQQVINESIKNKYEDEKIYYLFSILDYPIGNNEFRIELHIFKMKQKYNKFHDYIKYCDDGKFKILYFSDNKDTFLVLNNKFLEKLILYTEDNARENYKISQNVADFYKDYERCLSPK